MCKKWIDTWKTTFDILNVGAEFEWTYDESGFDLLLKRLKKISGKRVSVVIDELQCVRGHKDGAKGYLQKKIITLRGEDLLGCFVGVGTTNIWSVKHVDSSGRKLPPPNAMFVEFFQFIFE